MHACNRNAHQQRADKLRCQMLDPERQPKCDNGRRDRDANR